MPYNYHLGKKRKKLLCEYNAIYVPLYVHTSREPNLPRLQPQEFAQAKEYHYIFGESLLM